MEKRIKMMVPGKMEYTYDETGKYIGGKFIEDEDGSATFKNEKDQYIEPEEKVLEKIFNN